MLKLYFMRLFINEINKQKHVSNKVSLLPSINFID